MGDLEESILVYPNDHGGRRRAVRGCLRAVRGDWQVSTVLHSSICWLVSVWGVFPYFPSSVVCTLLHLFLFAGLQGFFFLPRGTFTGWVGEVRSLLTTKLDI